MGGVVIIGAASFLVIKRLLRSNTAKKIGNQNLPDDFKTLQRLVWLAEREKEILPIVKEVFPSAYMSSAYRNAAVNAAVDGAPNSRHKLGLAFDIGGIGNLEQTRKAARQLRDNQARLRVKPKTVFAEIDHVHIEFYDVNPKNDTMPDKAANFWKNPQTYYAQEVPGRQRGEPRTSVALV
jgi:hypothetical protein